MLNAKSPDLSVHCEATMRPNLASRRRTRLSGNGPFAESRALPWMVVNAEALVPGRILGVTVRTFRSIARADRPAAGGWAAAGWLPTSVRIPKIRRRRILSFQW